MNSVVFSIDEICSICNAEILKKSNFNAEITEIATDSRHITENKKILFIALKGEQHNGHSFIEEAFAKGINNFLVSNTPSNIQKFKNCNLIKVADTLCALQTIASAHRKKFNIPTLAITGSNGKTMVKEWLYQLLSADKNIVRSPKSYNSQVGVPLSVLNMAKDNDFAIFEAGISKIGEMDKLEKIIQPTLGIITNIGSAHDENFLNHKQKAEEKVKLFKNCKKIIYCQDEKEIHKAIKTSKFEKKTNLFSWGKSQKNFLHIIGIKKSNSGTTAYAKCDGKMLELFIPFADQASIADIIHCWCFMLSEGISHSIIAQRILTISSIEMRLEVKDGKNYCSIINDTYNSDINSLSIAIDFLEKNKSFLRKTIILSDILQSGKNSKDIASEIAKMIEKRQISQFIGIGTNLYKNQNVFKTNSHFFKTTNDFLNNFNLSSFHNELILLKGARQFEFENISFLLENKVHETVLEIDLHALTHNFNFFKSKLKPNTFVMAMVKAFAYGSGSIEIARHLEYHRTNYFAVAYTDEGIALRNAEITNPIMVASTEDNNYFFLFKYSLEPEIYSKNSLQKLIENIKKYSSIISEPVKIHLKFDSGMHRLGFVKEEIEELYDLLQSNSDKTKVASVFSHFTSSDNIDERDHTLAQFNRFVDFATNLETKLGYKVIKHIANSSGILHFPETHLDMVRIGIGLYGIDPSGINSAELLPVASLHTKVLQIKEILPRETVGYSRKAYSDKPRRTATLAIGYADGLHRKLGNGNWSVYFEGQKAPIIGNVCMDMCIADITNIKNIKEGDYVEIFGPNNTILDYAKAMESIPYEALTSVSSRVKRVYVQKD